jgi:ABC-type branched-subunit amino acid transport system substrate-binding protein
MLRKIGVVAAIAATLSVVVATTAWGSAKAPRHLSAVAAKTIKCGKTVTIGMAYPATGPAASLGKPQFDWASYAKKRWNKKHRPRIKIVQGDTKLGDSPGLAVPVAHSFASNGKMLAVVGPAGSQENQDSTAIYQKAGLVTVSGSATRIFLTRAKPGNPRETKKGEFFRTVPNDGQQGDRVARFIHETLKFKHVYIIDDEEAYSTGLADQVAADLQKDGVNSGRNHISQQNNDFSSVITAIPSNTQVVYIPWQLPEQAQAFYQQLRASGKHAAVMGSDGTDAPGTFQPNGHGYVSGFPVDFTSPTLKTFEKAHNNQPETFGIPSYTATWVVATAIHKACKAGHGKTTRVAVRKAVQKVKLSDTASLLGFAVQFLNKNKGTFQGPGDMGGKADFAVYQVNKSGTYVRVG